MLIIGITAFVLGLLHGAFKYFVIRNAARDVYNGGGVPVLDFVIFVPLWLSIGASVLLKHFQVYPFSFFGIAVYFVLAAIFYGIMEFEYHRGKPEVQKQLDMILARNPAEPCAPPNGGPAAAGDNPNALGGPPSVS